MNNANSSTDRYATMASNGASPRALYAQLEADYAAGRVDHREFRLAELCIEEFENDITR